MVKKICSFNLDEIPIGMLDQVSRMSAKSKSEIVERALYEHFKNADELTPEQRYHSHRETISKTCSDTLLLASIREHEGGVSDKILLILALLHNSRHQKINLIRYGIQKISLFEILNQVKAWDKNIFDKIISQMVDYRKLKEEYFNLYPE